MPSGKKGNKYSFYRRCIEMVCRTLSNIYDRDFFRKIVNGEESLCNFAKKLDHRFLTGS